MIHVMADNGSNISSSMDGAMYNVFSGRRDFIIEGIGQEYGLSYSSNSFIVSVGSGQCLICGRHVFNDETINLPLAQNDSGSIVLRFDLTQVDENICKLMAVNSIYDEDINSTGLIHDIVLATYVTNANGVSSLVDKRDIIDALSGLKNPVFTITKDEQDTELQTPITFSIVKAID